ncbi:MAG: KEOPS complex subunit Pcc1 [Candidatus Hydrothermarchaeaceae archaeon]
MNLAKAKIALAFNSEKEANAIYRALEPEACAGPTDRAKVTLHHDKKKLELKVRAKDASSFRAGIYTYSRWIRMAKSLSEV